MKLFCSRVELVRVLQIATRVLPAKLVFLFLTA